MRRSSWFVFLAAGLLTASGAVAGSTGEKIVPMPFAECESIIAEIAGELDAEPVVLASGADLQAVRIDAADGFVTVACDRADGTMSLSKTAHTVTASR